MVIEPARNNMPWAPEEGSTPQMRRLMQLESQMDPEILALMKRGVRERENEEADKQRNFYNTITSGSHSSRRNRSNKRKNR